jgi:hypothetical protein
MRAAAVALATVLLLAAPAAAEPFTDADLRIDVPAGWQANGTMAPGAVVRMKPKNGLDDGEIKIWRVPPAKPQAVPATARAGSTKVGGSPAASFVWEEAQSKRLMSASRVHVLVRVSRGGKAWEIRADYAKPAGDLTVDRRWNVAMSLIVRSWKWRR